MKTNLNYQTLKLKKDLLEDEFFNTILTDEEIDDLIKFLKEGCLDEDEF